MSLEDLKKYVDACANDDALRAKAKEIGVENIAEQIKHAKSLGYHWDESDIQAFTEEMQAKGELSDADLENVSGGIIIGMPMLSAVTSVSGSGGW